MAKALILFGSITLLLVVIHHATAKKGPRVTDVVRKTFFFQYRYEHYAQKIKKTKTLCVCIYIYITEMTKDL